MNRKLYTAAALALLAGMILGAAVPAVSKEPLPKAVLARGVMCEGIENFKPVQPAVVFPISLGELFCFTSFDPVRETTRIFHKWYKRDKLIFTMRLTLSPPKWSSFSRIQIRDIDKGPWRVEVQDEKGQILQTLRFSMSD